MTDIDFGMDGELFCRHVCLDEPRNDNKFSKFQSNALVLLQSHRRAVSAIFLLLLQKGKKVLLYFSSSSTVLMDFFSIFQFS